VLPACDATQGRFDEAQCFFAEAQRAAKDCTEQLRLEGDVLDQSRLFLDSACVLFNILARVMPHPSSSAASSALAGGGGGGSLELPLNFDTLLVAASGGSCPQSGGSGCNGGGGGGHHGSAAAAASATVLLQASATAAAAAVSGSHEAGNKRRHSVGAAHPSAVARPPKPPAAARPSMGGGGAPTRALPFGGVVGAVEVLQLSAAVAPKVRAGGRLRAEGA